ncbi:MAG: bifunctional diaminohydroxyphosphoribosylaminopyrimidine deaminase/5-amino-6-(5-phosphoribosylamino)uracil reductase RibD [Planctomycetota bacterium]|jgi:diaminohydroxyphosphoribosylaminopyrimidine deaminase/5-amino-6-(5-phosphoribosylamino)uracil reductase
MNDLLQAPDRATLGRLLAELGQASQAHRFEVAPNPCVGAAILDEEGRVLARGYHERWGGPHAEVQAVRAAQDRGIPEDRWHTLCVTLEPCSTSGKTPACTDLIQRHGFQRVIVGGLDPDARHRGQGLELLRAAGVKVEEFFSASPVDQVAPYFARWNAYERVRRPRPWIIAKWAQTRSGHLSPPEDIGEGRWISAPESLREVQLLRERVDAILTGVGTVRADDPRLTLRFPAALDHPPARVVLDSELSMSPDSRLLQPTEPGAAGGPVSILCRAGARPAQHRALEAAGARVHSLRPDEEGRVAWREALGWMWRKGYRRVLVEAGPTLLRSLFEAGFVDQLRVYTGDVIGGRGESLANLFTQVRMEQRLDREVGPDAVLEAFVDGRWVEPR